MSQPEVPIRAALLAMAREDLPDDLAIRVERAVSAIWEPAWAGRSGGWPDVEVLVTAHDRLDATRLAQIPGLQVILTTSTATNFVDTRYCSDHGIVVRNTPGYSGSSVAEHAVALMLAVVRHVPRLDAAARSGADTADLVGRELAGTVAGVVGLGNVGARIARIALGFGMDVIYANRSPRVLDGTRQVDLEVLLRAADAVFLSLPLPADGRPLLGAAEFALMKDSAVIVNVSADELIDPSALAQALSSGRLAGAGLDVIGSPAAYAGLPRTVLTPTHAWFTSEAIRRRADTWVSTLCLLADGQMSVSASSRPL